MFQTGHEETAEQLAWTQTVYFEELMATEQVCRCDKPQIAELKAPIQNCGISVPLRKKGRGTLAPSVFQESEAHGSWQP